MSVLDHEDINGMILEYLRASELHKVADSIEQEIKSMLWVTQASMLWPNTRLTPKGLTCLGSCS